MHTTSPQPSTAFVLASWAALIAGIAAYLVGLWNAEMPLSDSWAALIAGIAAYLVGLWNAEMPLSEKGYYFTVLMYGLFSAISLQKSVRDRLEDIPVTALYFGLCWVSVLLAIALLVIGLWNATLLLSEKGFYGMAFILAMFAAVTVQKNTRDLARSTLTSEPTARAHARDTDVASAE